MELPGWFIHKIISALMVSLWPAPPCAAADTRFVLHKDRQGSRFCTLRGAWAAGQAEGRDRCRGKEERMWVNKKVEVHEDGAGVRGGGDW